MKRFNKELPIGDNMPFSIKIGTTNKNNSKVFYISGCSWINPLFESDFSKNISIIFHQFKKNIYAELSKYENLSNKFILNFDSKEKAMKKNKKSYFTFEIYARQKENEEKNIFYVAKKFDELASKISYDLKELFENNGFSII